MSPLGPMGDPSFVSREVRGHVSEMDREAADAELQHQARLAREGRGSRSHSSALDGHLSRARRIAHGWFVIARWASGRPITPIASIALSGEAPKRVSGDPRPRPKAG